VVGGAGGRHRRDDGTIHFVIVTLRGLTHILVVVVIVVVVVVVFGAMKFAFLLERRRADEKFRLTSAHLDLDLDFLPRLEQ